MKKIFFTLILGLIMSFGLLAQNEMWIYNSDGTIKTCKISEVDSINFTANMINMLLYKNGDNNTLSVAAIDSIVFKQIVNPGDDNQGGNEDDNQGGNEDDNQGGNEDDNQGDIPGDGEYTAVYVEFDGDKATVRHDIDSEKFVVGIEGADVSVATTAGIKNIRYYLSGQTTDGSFALESDSEFDVVLNGVNITSSAKVPLDLAKKVERNIIVANGTVNVLTDNTGCTTKYWQLCF